MLRVFGVGNVIEIVCARREETLHAMVQRSICKVPHSFPNPCARSLARQGDREHATEVKARAPSVATLQQSRYPPLRYH
jgi:hypothetical protein